jgi:hypothetical protein
MIAAIYARKNTNQAQSCLCCGEQKPGEEMSRMEPHLCRDCLAVAEALEALK